MRRAGFARPSILIAKCRETSRERKPKKEDTQKRVFLFWSE